MPWWGWIIVGAVLLGAELALVEAEFYLVFLGVSALLVGGVVLAAPDFPVWLQWLGFAAIAVTGMVTFRNRMYEKLRGGAAGEVGDGLRGEIVLVGEAIVPGATGRGELRGTTWTLRNVGDAELAAGDRARVEASRGLVLDVAPPDA
jgi:membrane protein implicated in regulation of membrane protease activity